MKSVFVIAIATRTPAWLAELEGDYATRIAGFRLQTIVIKPAASDMKTTAAVMAKVPAKARLVLMDAQGETMDSDKFARNLQSLLQDSRPPVFLIGGAAGAPIQLREQAEAVWSLSPLTFAHAPARLILTEQLFRADCCLRNHPYPR